MKHLSLGDLLSTINRYEEYQAVFIAAGPPFTLASRCALPPPFMLDPNDFLAVPGPLKEQGMIRFLSAGQLMDIEGALQVAKESHSEADLLAALAEAYRQFAKPART